MTIMDLVRAYLTGGSASEWTSYALNPWSSVALVDGTSQVGGTVMRRYVRGVWQYRRPTPTEEAEIQDLKAW